MDEKRKERLDSIVPTTGLARELLKDSYWFDSNAHFAEAIGINISSLYHYLYGKFPTKGKRPWLMLVEYFGCSESEMEDLCSELKEGESDIENRAI
ncbi:hypothetical protein [Hutsoniella sourekii]|uniref:hypothetical protein n=1 Tax=Hutsoniella sourekii TaxID=87650 RepID=UPI0004895CD9|nr:hypothetical protein [Hutsoniella sourekii]